jgi:hypothetical protein
MTVKSNLKTIPRSSMGKVPVARGLARIARRRPPSQRSFAFVERSRRLARQFKVTIALGTLLLVSSLLLGTSSGRYAARWVERRCRWSLLRTAGLSPDRAEVDADWQRKRLYDIGQTRGKLREVYAGYDPAMKRLLTYAGLDPDHALLRWGNFDRTLYLPSTVFEPDDTGRSYRFRPNTRSIWVRNMKLRGDILAYFPILDRPDLPDVIAGTGAIVVSSSVQNTNSWGLRGPEPNTAAILRGIVLGDSYMQGLFVGDDQTPPECLKRNLSRSLKMDTEILNTGHLGYSPEQEFYTLVEYADVFHPQFVVLSLFANDFGDLFEVLEGKGDWAEGSYWLGRIVQFCRNRQLICLVVPAPWINQVEGTRKAGNYPGQISNILTAVGMNYLDPIEEFTEEYVRQMIARTRRGEPTTPNPLFNGQLGDGHFSPLGCELWARVVGRRLILLIEKARAEKLISF